MEQRAARLGVDPAILLPTPIDSMEEPPQVWTRYEFNSSSVFNSFEMYFTWHEAPLESHLFQGFQFFFEADQGGYIGPQIVGSTRKMIFSIWDLRDRPETAVPLGPDCARFNGAGENGGGARCLITHNWIPGRKYRLQVARYGVGTDLSAYWQGVVRDTVTGDQITIGQIGLRSASGRVGYGWLTNDPGTFLEYFADQTHCAGQPRSRLTWQGPYANGDEAITPYSAEPAYTSCPLSDVSSTGLPFITHEGGDGSVRSFEARVNAWRYSTRQADLLFSYPDHHAELQHFDTNTEQRTVAKTFYPPGSEYRAFQYQKLPNGSAKLLWSDPSDGSAILWSLDSNNDLVGSRQFLSNQPGVWKAVAYYKLPQGARLLWGNQSGGAGQISIWKLDENDDVVSQVIRSVLPPAWKATAYTLDEGVPAVVWVNTGNPLRCEAMLGWFDLDGNYLGSISLPSGSGACRQGDSVGYQSRGLKHLFYFSEDSFLSLLRPDYTRQSTLLHQPFSDPALVHFSYVSAVAASEPPPGLSIRDASVQEGDQGATTMVFRATLSRPIDRPVTVSYETADGSAVAAAGDYAPTAGVLTFSPGTTEQTIAVAAHGDRTDEGAGEAFYVRLLGSIFPVLLLDGEAVGNIVDDDPAPRISTEDNSVVEGSSGTRALNYHLQLDRPSAFEVKVTLRTEDVTARAGADYEGRNGQHTFPAGQTDMDVPISVIGDRLYEPGPDETFWVKLENPVNATVDPPRPQGWRGAIVDDDPVPTVSVADCTRVEGNKQSVPCAFAVSLSNPSTQDVSVSYTTVDQTAGAGTDFQRVTGVLSFPPESVNRTVEVPITGDAEGEWNEAFLIALSSPTNAGIADGYGLGTIIDDEPARFHRVTPCRVLDTRRPTGASGGPILTAGVPRSFPISEQCGVPGTAKAVAVNVATTAQSEAGNLRLYPAGLSAPETSVLNFTANATLANNAIVLLGSSGQATVQADLTGSGQAHVIVDVVGYYESIVDADPGALARRPR